MRTRRKWQVLGATVGSSLVLLGTAGLGSGAQAAGSFHKCGSKSFTVQVPQGTTPETFASFKEVTKNVEAKGLSCTEALKFLKLQVSNRTATVPEHFKCKPQFGKPKEPSGYFAEGCTRGSAKIVYGQQGG
jgi:hypothetical protein